jgi:hypothetical protein
MATFSLNIGLSTEATAYPLVSYADVDNFFYRLIDNETKLINPVDLRDCILSLYSSSGFKVTDTAVSTKKYIGIDTLNPSDRDVKRLIYLGKRSFSGTYSYTSSDDILSTFSYSTTETDIYFFNTKRDTIDNNETKISIIAGTSLGLHTNSAYIRTQKVTSTSSLSFDFVNPSINGNIDIRSDYATVSFNDIVFPTITESFGSASNLKTFKWDNGKLIWDDITYNNVGYIGMTGVDLQIYGQPVNINGFPLELTDSRKMPIKFNDMILGTTFSQEPITDVIKKLLYPYLPPLCSISIQSPYSQGFSEVGTSPVPIVQFSITKRTLPTSTATLINMIPGIYPSITTLGQVTQTSTSTGVVITPITTAITTFQISVNDGTQSATASTTIQGVYPYFYGFSSLSTMTTIGLSSLTKSVEKKSDKNFAVTGNGNLYFIYDSVYGTLSNIYDWLGNTASASFSHSTQVFSSPSGLWAAKQFHVYKWSGSPQIGPPALNFYLQY